MIRRTSIETYNKIVENGMLSFRQGQVYNCLYNYGSQTQKQVWERLNESGCLQIRSITPRFSELERMGVVYVSGRTKDQLIWDLTGNLPTRPEKRLTIKEQLENKIKLLEERIKALEKENVELKQFTQKELAL